MAIELVATDVEGRWIQENGLLAVVYDEQLYGDHAAMSSVASQDNLNQQTQLAETEMNVFCRVSFVFEEPATDKKPASEKEVLKHLESMGLGPFTTQEWSFFIVLRVALPKRVADMMVAIQFQATSSQVRVRAANFGTVAKMDTRCSILLVATVLFL